MEWVIKGFEMIKVDIKHLLHAFIWFDKLMHMGDVMPQILGSSIF